MYFSKKSIQSDPEAFPKFSAQELKTVQEAGETCVFQPGEKLVEAGSRRYCGYNRSDRSENPLRTTSGISGSPSGNRRSADDRIPTSAQSADHYLI
jgi:hypothetical protein